MRTGTSLRVRILKKGGKRIRRKMVGKKLTGTLEEEETRTKAMRQQGIDNKMLSVSWK